ncbi:aminotransferase class I/II-fold pyridoxal phosphate-dependent enzyme [Selenomonas sp. KH1T6]|uniref:aminotransferase class I/II-fold pyridoxal phosphate-dependent enzyme n=1 Tax=Selenomonas sp. KH1T6 TaxID=3158784 RepID=UPI0008A7CBF0|nr:Arginine/lysine/ornithine decarboxylase [Selenomonas ruminantium]
MDMEKKKLCAPIAEAMKKYREDGALAFHTPGHKQGLGAHPLLQELITEKGLREEVSLMEELDDLHEPSMCIAEAQKLAAELYGAGQAYFCINGTTGAVQAMLLGTLSSGDKVLVPRNVHRSIIGGLILSGARPVYLQPEIDERLGIPVGLGIEALQEAVEANPEARAVVLVYPTYYGTAVDLKPIADFLHSRDMLLLVDEAHGPHLPFSEGLPSEAIAAGADAAALSTHKILGSMTQTSMLLVNKETRMDRERLRESMSLLQSTSPNQLLLASLDIARLQMAEQGSELVGRAVALSRKLREEINKIEGLWSPGADDFCTPGACGLDLTKITVQVKELGISGLEAEHYLRFEEKVQCELSDAWNLLFIISYADGGAQGARLLEALQALSRHARRLGKKPLLDCLPPKAPLWQEAELTPREAFFAEKEKVAFAEAAGRIIAEQVMFYPPGVPLLVPGERISREMLDYIGTQQALGMKIVGPEDTKLKTLKVVKEK